MPDQPIRSLGRNDPCHCGSGRKYKVCCLDKDEAAQRELRQKALSEAPAPSAEEAKGHKAGPRHETRQPWKGGFQNTRGFQKVSATRKVGGGG